MTSSLITQTAKAAELRRLHEDRELLVLVNVWDAASARVVAALPGCRAIATASYAIAAVHGYADGEQIPLELMIAAIERIVSAVQLPVTADMEAGYGDPQESVRRAIGVGVVGVNIEDQMKPFAESILAVQATVSAGSLEGIDLVVNARTDVFLSAGEGDRSALTAEAIRRGRAFLEAGATCVFVPGRLDVSTVAALVEGIGVGRVSALAFPDGATPAQMAELGVTRVSFGPWPYRAALDGLADIGAILLGGGALPTTIRSSG